MTAAIEFRNLSVAVPQGRTVLHDISLALEEGTTTAILGRSGSGKSTLLRTVNRMIEPKSGEVLVGGKSVSARRRDCVAARDGLRDPGDGAVSALHRRAQCGPGAGGRGAAARRASDA